MAGFEKRDSVAPKMALSQHNCTHDRGQHHQHHQHHHCACTCGNTLSLARTQHLQSARDPQARNCHHRLPSPPHAGPGRPGCILARSCGSAPLSCLLPARPRRLHSLHRRTRSLFSSRLPPPWPVWTAPRPPGSPARPCGNRQSLLARPLDKPAVARHARRRAVTTSPDHPLARHDSLARHPKNLAAPVAFAPPCRLCLTQRRRRSRSPDPSHVDPGSYPHPDRELPTPTDAFLFATVSSTTVANTHGRVDTAPATMSSTTTASITSPTNQSQGNQGNGSSGPTSSPLLFFVALGFGVVFTNLWYRVL